MRKCDKCGAQNATTHVKTIINGELTEYDLCSACAHKLGYNNVFADMESDFSNLLGSFNPSIVRIHGNAAHCGKHSKAAELEKQQEKPQKKEETVKDLQAQLEKAVARQDFERAAELRDKIREMEGSK